MFNEATRGARSSAPDLLDLWHHEVELLNDDRVGRCLDRLFDGLDADLVMKVVRQVIDQFHINLDELHNDSTSVSFFGAYPEAEEESRPSWPAHLWPLRLATVRIIVRI